jgi:hypothetical protein
MLQGVAGFYFLEHSRVSSAARARPLIDAAIRNAKPADKPIRLFDGGGVWSIIGRLR